MSAPRPHEALIDRLGTDLVPVRRLLPPWMRAAAWLLVVAIIAGLLVMHFGIGGMLRRFAGTPDLGWAGVGAVLTAISAAWVAFSLGVPGRRASWAWLPVPGALLWIGASGMGCLRDWVAPGTQIAGMHQSADCLVFIVSLSVPLSVLLIVLLRRAYPVRPVLTAVMIGLASAAASASLLEICHSYDAAATDLLTHALAVVLVIAANAAMGGRLLSKAEIPLA
ncbi:NrsF family protein [Rhodanobacter sp. L36]|uniref:NrsF family protein n=1 Tax=Rhodanobacter sp. L36 TaxID=1747221 RepID=UPI00131BD38A|nr:NrsF family protein [Rhodanobacter sp. L36]